MHKFMQRNLPTCLVTDLDMVLLGMYAIGVTAHVGNDFLIRLATVTVLSHRQTLGVPQLSVSIRQYF